MEQLGILFAYFYVFAFILQRSGRRKIKFKKIVITIHNKIKREKRLIRSCSRAVSLQALKSQLLNIKKFESPNQHWWKYLCNRNWQTLFTYWARLPMQHGLWTKNLRNYSEYSNLVHVNNEEMKSEMKEYIYTKQ